MRITIDTDDLVKNQLGLADGATDIVVIDAGPAPIEHIKRMSSVFAAADGGGMSPAHLQHDLNTQAAQVPLNPLRAGAAASQKAPAAQDSAVATTDGGRAAHITDKKLATVEAAAPTSVTSKSASSRAKTAKPRTKR